MITAQKPTLLVITPLSGGSAFEFPDFAGRNLTQSLEPSPSLGGSGNVLGSLIMVDINGSPMDLTYPQFRKYNSTVSCREQVPPALDDAWHGAIVQVQCAAELAYLTAGGSPNRPVVSGSSRTEGNFTFYRPELIMMVTGIRCTFEEWSALYNWSIDLREM